MSLFNSKCVVESTTCNTIRKPGECGYQTLPARSVCFGFHALKKSVGLQKASVVQHQQAAPQNLQMNDNSVKLCIYNFVIVAETRRQIRD